MRRLFLFLFLLVVAAGAWLAYTLLVPVKASAEFVMLRPGWSSRHIAEELQRQGAIRNAKAFLVYHYIVRPKSLKAGEYQFANAQSALQVHQRLVRGDIYKHTVVIPEGFNIFDVATAMQSAGLGTRDEFLKQAQGLTSLVSDVDPKATSLEGYLFPDTYEFTRTQSTADMIGIMVRRFRQEAKALGMLPSPDPDQLHRLVTMASIVEKETAAPDERPLVASVYYNRLAQRIALGADPTVVYAALLAGRYTGVIHQSDLQFDSPYNTYKVAGLPPGPICNPGRASLAAALHPSNSDYLYFVSDNQGHHRFARSLDEHARNVAAYRRALGAANR